MTSGWWYRILDVTWETIDESARTPAASIWECQAWCGHVGKHGKGQPQNKHKKLWSCHTRCFALRLLLRGEYCSLRHLHTATSPAKRHTTRLAISYASLKSRAALDASTCISSCFSENVCSPESTQQPIAVHGLGIPSTTVSQQPIAIRMVESARRQQTASYRSSEELWQSTLVHVIRITLEMVSAKVKESKYLASDSSHCSVS